MSFLGELKRRNVFRVAGVYTVVGWLLVQVAATVEEAISLPAWFDAVVLSFLVIVFPIALIFAWAFELTPDGIKRTAAVAPGESITAQTGSRLDVVLILSFLLFAVALLLPRFFPDTELPATTQTDLLGIEPGADAAAQPPGPNDASIAVLPFADLSKAKDQEYFADGISEELLNVLAQVKGMKVAGRTSSFAFKDRNEDLREIGRILNVAHILEGSVRSQGDRVRVTAQLIQVSDGFHLWSATYDRDLTDIFAVQDDIAQQILLAMTEHLMVDTAPVIAPATRTDLTAYGLFLEARDLIFSRDVEKMERALGLLNRALEIDPAYAPAYASRAKAVLMLSDRPGSYGAIPAQESLTRAQADLERALALDAELADGYAVMGLLLADSGEPDRAVSNLRRAVDLNPNSLDARNWLAIALTHEGRLRDVLEQLKALVAIDPLYEPGVNNALVYALEVGDWALATDIRDRFAAIGSDERAIASHRSSLAVAKGQIAEAIRIAEAVGLPKSATRFWNSVRYNYMDLGINPSDTTLGDMDNRGIIFQTSIFGDPDASVRQARQFVDESPEFFAVHAFYIRALYRAREDEVLAAYFASEYGGRLETYATRLRPSASADSPPYKELAVAMRAVGNQPVFTAAMQRWRFDMDMFRAGGSVAPALDLEEAQYWAILEDADHPLELLNAAFDKRSIIPVYAFSDRAFDALRDDPQFLSLRARNLKRVNEERAALGYEPLTEAFYARVAQ